MTGTLLQDIKAAPDESVYQNIYVNYLLVRQTKQVNDSCLFVLTSGVINWSDQYDDIFSATL